MFTGKQRLLDSAGRVEKFQRKYESFYAEQDEIREELEKKAAKKDAELEEPPRARPKKKRHAQPQRPRPPRKRVRMPRPTPPPTSPRLPMRQPTTGTRRSTDLRLPGH